MSRRWRWAAPHWITILGLIVAALIVFVALFDWNWMKGPLERRVSAATGREFAIDGDLDVDLGRVIRIRADRIRLANAEWGERPRMLEIERADLHVAFWPLWRGEVLLPAVHLERPRLMLERNEHGEANWNFDSREQERRKGASRLPRVERLTIADGGFDLVEPLLKTRLHVDVRSGKPERAGSPPPLLIEGDGKYRDGRFELRGRIDSPLELLRRANPYRIDLRVLAGTTVAHARGALASTVQPENFDLQLRVTGEDLADLYPLVGIALPETPPYDFDGRLGRTGSVWAYRNFTGRMGDSDVAGDASFDVGGERPLLRANVVSRRLDFDDLAGAVGGTPQTGAGESASPEQRERAAARAAQPNMLPDRSFDLKKLRSMDADVTLRAAAINAPKLPLDSASTHLRLDDGVLQMQPLELGVAGGAIRGTVTVDAGVAPMATTLDLKVRGIDLPLLFPRIKSDSTGRIGGTVQLAGRGNSVADMMATADGRCRCGHGAGPRQQPDRGARRARHRRSAALRSRQGQDDRRALRLTESRCREGVMTSQSMVFDTTDTAIVGAGKIDLRDEKLDLELRPLPKDESPIALRVPLDIGGTFKDPSFRPAAAPLAARTLAAALCTRSPRLP